MIGDVDFAPALYDGSYDRVGKELKVKLKIPRPMRLEEKRREMYRG